MTRYHKTPHKLDAFPSAKARTNSYYSSDGQFPAGSGDHFSNTGYPGGFPDQQIGPYGGGNPGLGGGGFFGNLLGGGAGGKSGLGNLSFNEIKSMIDRMGGIDGIMNTVTKVNKMMQTVNQMSPMLKLLMGSLFKKASTTDEDEFDEEIYFKPRRRRRRKKTSAKRRRSNSSKKSRGKKRTSRPR